MARERLAIARGPRGDDVAVQSGGLGLDGVGVEVRVVRGCLGRGEVHARGAFTAALAHARRFEHAEAEQQQADREREHEDPRAALGAGARPAAREAAPSSPPPPPPKPDEPPPGAAIESTASRRPARTVTQRPERARRLTRWRITWSIAPIPTVPAHQLGRNRPAAAAHCRPGAGDQHGPGPAHARAPAPDRQPRGQRAARPRADQDTAQDAHAEAPGAQGRHLGDRAGMGRSSWHSAQLGRTARYEARRGGALRASRRLRRRRSWSPPITATTPTRSSAGRSRATCARGDPVHQGREGLLDDQAHQALITSYSVSGHGGGVEDRPLESWVLNGTKIEYEADMSPPAEFLPAVHRVPPPSG